MVVTLPPSSSLPSPSPRRDSAPLLATTTKNGAGVANFLLHFRLVCSRLTHLASCRIIQAVFLAISVLLCLVIYTTVRSSSPSTSENEFLNTDLASSSVLASGEKSHSNKRKVILFWTQWFDKPFPRLWDGGGTAPFVKRCPKAAVSSNCEMTDDRSRIKEADAVVFHVPDLVGKLSLFGGYDVPSYRSPHQKYVFYNLESPAHTLTRLSGFENFFNLTMTYRRDSDIYHPYASFQPIDTTFQSNTSSNAPALPRVSSLNMLQNKTGWVAWVVSRCFTHSRREHYIANLRKHIPVDIWGRCGSATCSDQCFKDIGRNYRFYVSIENSLCTDYVTEKFFSRMRELDAILIVLQANNASATVRDNYATLAPPNSYIDASKFVSPEALAGYLRAIGSEPSMFSSFFKWRKNYTIRRTDFEPFCELCQMVHDEKLPRKTYADIREWWVGGTKRKTDGSLDETASKPHCQPGAKFNTQGEAAYPPFAVPYFIHIQS